MQTLEVQLGTRSYPIHIAAGLLQDSALLAAAIPSRQVMIVTNTIVAPLYLEPVRAALAERDVAEIILPDGESWKTMESAMQVFDLLLARRFSRNACIVALGGGVIGDLAGYVAAAYQRGVPFVQIPTTLLSQVDSSVGGKTAVNHPRGKNMIGAFHQPRAVIADTATLATLPDRELSAGLAEIIKYGLIRDPDFFNWLETSMERLLARDPEALAYAIARSCHNKAEVVAEDETESGVRATLNLGHTFGHAIETGMGYGVCLHGEAVAIGMCQAADLSCRLGWLGEADMARIIALIARARLPVHPPAAMSTAAFLDHMAVDKKNVDGGIRLILLRAIGEATLPTAVYAEQLQATLDHYGR